VNFHAKRRFSNKKKSSVNPERIHSFLPFFPLKKMNKSIYFDKKRVAKIVSKKAIIILIFEARKKRK